MRESVKILHFHLKRKIASVQWLVAGKLILVFTAYSRCLCLKFCKAYGKVNCYNGSEKEVTAYTNLIVGLVWQVILWSTAIGINLTLLFQSHFNGELFKPLLGLNVLSFFD
uniref:Uncharacterized protein n=1 Tax=Micrurus lemniscatus lemniscatus TaxID=129467 RepID=A0A2D4HA47_MICLE